MRHGTAKALDYVIHSVPRQAESSAGRGLADPEDMSSLREAVVLDIAKQEYLTTALP